ncbi:unnamed protein product [Hydatigera taeniaeformis]|uniref:PSP1 C-terminal domain-containing protein n=1 Tax=Hydatigena taeniaeformis TaxID=6205 RepID=A0A0R3XC55_HYDTA|nr:unnamed protein product [Hydatigera taeniaeformis]
MGNTQGSDVHHEQAPGQHRTVKSKRRKEAPCQREERAIQCGILLPPSPKDLARQNARYVTKMIQVGTRPRFRNRSTMTEFEIKPITSSMRGTLGHRLHHISHSEDRQRRLSNSFMHLQDPYRSPTAPYPDVMPGSCIFTTKQPLYFDLPKISRTSPKWMFGVPPMNDFTAFQPGVLQPPSASGDNFWQNPKSLDHFEPFKQSQSSNRSQHVHIVEKPEIIPPTATDGCLPYVLRKARSWDGFLDHQYGDRLEEKRTPLAMSMDTILLPQQSLRSSSLNVPLKSQIPPTFYSDVCNTSSCFPLPRGSDGFVIPDTNQSNQSYGPANVERVGIGGDYIPFYRPQCQCCSVSHFAHPLLYGPHAGPIVPALSMANLSERCMRGMSHFSRANSMRTFKTGMIENERRRLMGLGMANNAYGWSSPTSPARGGLAKQICPLGDAFDKVAKNAPRLKSVSSGHPSRFRFYLKESPQVTKILLDTEDRRIRTICDRFQCDLEVYSKVPKSGFLQYAVDITAPDSTSLYACSRNLDSALGWFLTAQLTAARYLKY